MRLRTKLWAAVAAAAVSAGAFAQDDMLEEVLVTATKRATSLDDVAGGANVVGADLMGAGGVESVRDLISHVPNLSIGDQFGFARVFMRGIGMTSIDIGGEGAVSFLQDGAIVPRPASQLSGMFDLAQIEVLRGPQGTLYGRGATAGVINMVTAKPGNEVEGYADFSYGNYDAMTFEGAVSVPMSDVLSARLATKIEQRDGYGENKFSGEDVDDRDAQAYRLTLAYDGGNGFDATLSAQYYEEDDQNFAFHYFGQSAGSAAPVPLGKIILGGRPVFDEGGDLYDINSDQEAINERDGYLVNLIMNAELSDEISLRSITSVQNLDRFLRDDLDSTDANLFGQNNYTEESDSWSQEFVFEYNTDRLNVLAGAMYFEEELYGNVLVPLTNLCYLLAPAACGTPLGDFLNSGRYEQNGDVDITAYGVFAEATYEINEAFSIIAGARYNYEERDGTGFFLFSAAGIDLSTDQDENWDDITPRVTLEYRPSDNLMMYATYTEAFKSGVINTGSLSPPLDPETVEAWELGLKGSSEDGRISYSVAAFYYDYQDLQISFVDETSTVSTINAAEAENTGIEVEFRAQLSDAFSMDLFATWLSAEYEEFFNGDYANGFAIADLSGNTLPNAPEYTAKLGLNWEAPVAAGTLRVRGEAYYQDEIYFTEWNRDDAYQDSYTLIHASAEYSFMDDQWTVGIWGRNLGDEEVISNNIITAPLYDSLRVGSMLPPRTYGASVRYQF